MVIKNEETRIKLITNRDTAYETSTCDEYYKLAINQKPSDNIMTMGFLRLALIYLNLFKY